MNNIFLKTVTVFFLLFNISNAQDITNTLAPNGSFKIKDSVEDYFILNQSSGTISLSSPLEGNQRGSIFKGADRFLHTYHGNETDGFNTFLGLNAGNFAVGGYSFQGSYNTGVGFESQSSLTTGYYNSAFGSGSLYSNTEGVQNSAFGKSSLYYNTSSANSAFGYESLHFNTIGNNNCAFGSASLRNNTTGRYNSAVGVGSLLSNTTGNNNSAFGTNSLNDNTTGSGNSAFGFISHYNNTTGYENSAFGTESLFSNSIGRENTAVGYKTLYLNVSGFQNTAVGDSALYKNTGNYNTAIGYNAGSNVTTGANLTLIGIDANPSSPTAIDQITLGNQYVSSLRCNVQTITSLSDARDKKNIRDLTLGLDFITKLKPRRFNWDKRDWYEGGISDGSKIQEEPTAGFIAQEFDQIQKSENAEWLNLVLKDNPDKWEATYGNLLPVMVKAIQELAIRNEELRIKNEKLEIKNASLEERFAKYEEFQGVLVQRLEQLESGDQSSRVQNVNTENYNQ